MNIQVRFAEPFWRVVGQRNLEMRMASESNVRGLLALLCKQYPGISAEMAESTTILFVNEEEVDMDTILEEGDQVHILWPIAGG